MKKEAARSGQHGLAGILHRAGAKSDREKPPALTPRLFMLREGDRLAVGRKITGHFTADSVKPDDSVVFLSTGTGEAPHNYLTWQLLRQGHRGKMLSACCVRFRRDLGYLEMQDKLVKQYPNYKYLALTTPKRTPSATKSTSRT